MSKLNLIEILEAERLELGESQLAFSDRFDVNQGQYSSTKRKKAKLPQRSLPLVAEFLGIPLKDVQEMNEELVSENKKERTRAAPAAKPLPRTRSSSPSQLRAYLFTELVSDGKRVIDGDCFLECPIAWGDERLLKVMKTVAAAGLFGTGYQENPPDILIVDSDGNILYDGSREKPWAWQQAA
jgi:transcriptional regulator with XRE-family HTH domain